MTFMERWFEEVWTKGREEAIDEMMAPHTKGHGLKGPGWERDRWDGRVQVVSQDLSFGVLRHPRKSGRYRDGRRQNSGSVLCHGDSYGR